MPPPSVECVATRCIERRLAAIPTGNIAVQQLEHRRGDRMKRRKFIALLGGAALASPLGARAQQPTRPIMGFLSGLSEAISARRVAAFRQGLAESGVEGLNVTIEFRWSDGNYDRLRAMSAELVDRPVAVILAASLPAALAAKAATTSIPIVFVMC